jgi:hypothetical protein
VRIFWLTRGPTRGRLARSLKDLEHVMTDEDTVPVFLSMRIKCWCGYASDQDFLLDMPQDKAQSMQSSELTACPDCGAPIRIHLKRTSTAVGELRALEFSKGSSQFSQGNS